MHKKRQPLRTPLFHPFPLRILAMLILLSLIATACMPLPAAPAPPELDRVGFPTDYQSDYSVFYEFDRPDNKSARVIYANDAASAVQEGQPFPFGSILVMEVHRTLKDDNGAVVLDENDRYTREDLFGLFVMRKEAGYGAKYGDFRNGDWEYVAYRPDGSVLVPPQNTNGCASCHMEAGQGKDWVFGTPRHFGVDNAALEMPENSVNVVDYAFATPTITVTVGSEVTWVNNDVVMHTVTADDFSFGSGALRPQATFSHTFEEVGVFDYRCTIHSSMRGQVVVVAE